MKTNTISFRIDVSRKLLCVLACASALLLTGVAAVASADVEHEWVDGDVLTAVDLNANFGALDSRISALETSPSYLEAISEVGEAADLYTDLVSETLFLEIPAGRWLVSASASVATTVSADTVQLGLWDDAQGAEVPTSRGPLATTQALVGPYSCGEPGDSCSIVPMTTSAVIELSEPTTIRLHVLRNGASMVWLGIANDAGLTLQVSNRLTAQRL